MTNAMHLIIVVSLAGWLFGCMHQKNSRQALTPEQLFPTGLDYNRLNDNKMVRKGTVAAALANLKVLKDYFAEGAHDQKKAIAAVNSLRSLIPDLVSVGLFDVFNVDELFEDRNRLDRIVLGTLYKEETASHLDSALVPLEVDSLLNESRKEPALAGISPSDILPDGQDSTDTGVRKGTIFATIANIKALAKAQSKEENALYRENLRVLGTQLKQLRKDGLDLFDYFSTGVIKNDDPFREGKSILAAIMKE